MSGSDSGSENRAAGEGGSQTRPASNLLFILTGSIASYKACDAISQLVQRGHRVRTVATEAALRFVGTATLEGLTGQKVATDLFAEGAALDHIALARWADVTVVCPATANTLNHMAAGLADDLAGALLLAHDWQKPLLIGPAMNPAMWKHPATVSTVAKLQAWGARFIAVGEGRTACGEVGEGRLAEPDEIVAAIEASLARPPRRLRVLITSGGTAEPIDGVRMLTNSSTGETGAMMAEYFARRGHDVTLLRAHRARSAAARCREEIFTSFADLDAALARQLPGGDFDAIIHAAAVSDFSIDAIEVDGVSHVPGRAKLPSDRAPTLRLRRNPKLLDQLRARSRNPAVNVVAFKLTSGADEPAVRAAVQALFAGGHADFVVHNDIAQRAAGGAFPAQIWAADGDIIARCKDRLDIAPALETLLLESEVERLVPKPLSGA
ncbi:MAG TPA: bifunctional phosphopantothenoylcysteine decarboxylase/phosphopantothenate--cysteine ligase CoaBC, partial [Opitutaceae bacterium]|nr:bifunctional phosphopantothenoylcysteine decarboxylase/phosphopantothenate--cysteine ligase CoaBC [Opitutaceae bacterium]